MGKLIKVIINRPPLTLGSYKENDQILEFGVGGRLLKMDRIILFYMGNLIRPEGLFLHQGP